MSGAHGSESTRVVLSCVSVSPSQTHQSYAFTLASTIHLPGRNNAMVMS